TDAAGLPTVVPVQRGEDPNDPAADGAEAAQSGTSQRPTRTPRSAIGLTERELQVLLGMAEGKSNAEIGRELFVSEDTVKTHARRLFRKLGARDRAHAVAAGFRAGLVA
ncbi:response regulator transcription factor, partial [Micromonospora maritima]